MFRLGAKLAITERLSADINYRVLHAKQFLLIRDPAKADRHGWWEGSFNRDLSAVSVGINWGF